jgi:hypothetical protein
LNKSKRIEMSGSFRTHDECEKILPHFDWRFEKGEYIFVAGKDSETVWIGGVEMHPSELM